MYRGRLRKALATISSAAVLLTGAFAPLGGALAVESGGGASATTGLPCPAVNPPVVGPVALANWNSLFPIYIFGVPVVGGHIAKPHKMITSPVCTCPWRLSFGTVSLPGIMVNWFTPQFVAEASEIPGCISFLGVNPLESYSPLKRSGNRAEGGDGPQVKQNKRQVHLFENPMGEMLESLQGTLCSYGTTDISTSYLTEPDPLWQNDQWSVIFNPESILFANPIAALACAADFVGANIGQPIDELFWCSGSKTLYPLSAVDEISDDLNHTNSVTIHRFFFRQTRLGMMWKSIGPSAICTPHPTPIMSKQQYRIDPIWPLPPGFGSVAVFGMNKFMWRTTGTFTTQESGVFNIWKAVQCCARL